MTVEFPLPASGIIGDQLATELGVDPACVYVAEDRVVVSSDLLDEETAAEIVATHEPAPQTASRAELIEQAVAEAADWRSALVSLAEQGLL